MCLGLLFTFGCSKEDLAPDNIPATNQRSSSAAQVTDDGSLAVRRGNHYLIISATNKLPTGLAEQTKAANGEVTGTMEEVGIASATSSDPAFATKAARISGVRSVIHDFSYQGFNLDQERVVELTADADNTNPISSGDNDRFFPLQWGHTAIQAPEAWNAGARGKDVLVAVLDGGFDLKHPDLAGNIYGSKSFVTGEAAQCIPKPGKTFSHGSHTAGTIAAVDNTIGVIGVAPDAKLLLVKVLRDAGSGSFAWMMQGIYYAVEQHADVINMSLGASVPHHDKYRDDNSTPDDPSDDTWVNDTREIQELLVAISRVTTYATQHGITVIASAGNDANNGNQDKDLAHIPSGMPTVISVSATGPMGWAKNTSTDLDRVASYTNYGTAEVTFAAPGGDFMFPTNEVAMGFRGVNQYVWALDMVMSLTYNGYTWSAGTSMASPHVAGVAALIIGKHGSPMAPAQVLSVLRASADDLGKPGRDPYYGYGRVNALRAVTAVQ
jgi:subtilisin family serine protease